MGQSAEAREQVVAGWMLAFCRDGVPLSLRSLREVSEDAGEREVRFFNAAFYTFLVKRLVRWTLSPSVSVGVGGPASEGKGDATVSFDAERGEWRPAGSLPVASATARALQLCRAGYLSISELFQSHSPYSILCSGGRGIHNILDADDKGTTSGA
jgi:hypothetical protein